MTEARREKLEKVLNKRQTNLTVVLEDVHDPHNISAVMRTCDAVGIQDIYILNTYIPPFKKWGFKSSSSASKWMSIHTFEDRAICIRHLKSRYEKIYAACLMPDATSLFTMDLTKCIALVFGNEKDGVSEEMKLMVDGYFNIPQVGIIESLNISVACAITVYEAYRQRAAKNMYDLNQMDEVQKQNLRSSWGL
ncbi:MAG: RNA methyltransferase [Bacteroidetes bacterium]|nr:RNA methyltransferase [Bacteroidota bacterium]